MTPRDLEIREYVRCANIDAFTRELRGEIGDERRKLLERLLFEHEAMAPTRGLAPPIP